MSTANVLLAHKTGQKYRRQSVKALITGPNCHMCKQLIWENALHSGIDVEIVVEKNGVIKCVPISSLMQYPWPDEKGRH